MQSTRVPLEDESAVEESDHASHRFLKRHELIFSGSYQARPEHGGRYPLTRQRSSAGATCVCHEGTYLVAPPLYQAVTRFARAKRAAPLDSVKLHEALSAHCLGSDKGHACTRATRQVSSPESPGLQHGRKMQSIGLTSLRENALSWKTSSGRARARSPSRLSLVCTRRRPPSWRLLGRYIPWAHLEACPRLSGG